MYYVVGMTRPTPLITACVELIIDAPPGATASRLAPLAAQLVRACNAAGDPAATCEVVTGDVPCHVLKLQSTLPGWAAPAVLTYVRAEVEAFWRSAETRPLRI